MGADENLVLDIGDAARYFCRAGPGRQRSMMTHLTPPAVRNEMFGLYALSGKATAFMGPALLGWVTAAANSQRVGMATILIFFIIGLVLLIPIHEARLHEARR